MTLCSVYVANLFAIGGCTKLANFLFVLVAPMTPSRGTYSCSRACIAGLTPKSSAWRSRQINEKRVRLESATQLHRTEYESVRVVPWVKRVHGRVRDCQKTVLPGNNI